MAPKHPTRAVLITNWFQENAGPEGMTVEELVKGMHGTAGRFSITRWVQVYTAKGFLERHRKGRNVYLKWRNPK